MINVVGAGLAGSEAAWQITEYGFDVTLWEMRPKKMTAAHVSDGFAELVCSNSLGSDQIDRAGGLLKAELRRLNSLIMICADETRVPAGGALAVGREEFSKRVTERISNHPKITIHREECKEVPEGPTVIATGPLTSSALADNIGQLVGEEYLYFYDALSPIVKADSIDLTVAFRASRYGRGSEESGDYINCPMNKDEYEQFITALLDAERIELRSFESEDQNFFEGCLPIEELASRGQDALAYGPLRPVGLTDPGTGTRPYAVVQLRQDNVAGTLYNLVGFQTNLRWPEQRRILRLIPGLATAEFVRLGQMHRNTYINAPTLLRQTMQYRHRTDLFFAGQIVGIEGYDGNAGSGLLAGINAARLAKGEALWVLPRETMLGALVHYVCQTESGSFQPMKANFGLMLSLEPPVRNKRQRYQAYSDRGLAALEQFVASA